jgi:hypothetical protein
MMTIGWSRRRGSRRRPALGREEDAVTPSGDRTQRFWSGEVTRTSNALDLDPAVFTWKSPRKIALSLKRSAETSRRRKAPPFRSAMSMLTFYLNRAGRNLSPERRAVLNRAKDELRKAFGRLSRKASSRPRARTRRVRPRGR